AAIGAIVADGALGVVLAGISAGRSFGEVGADEIVVGVVRLPAAVGFADGLLLWVQRGHHVHIVDRTVAAIDVGAEFHTVGAGALEPGLEPIEPDVGAPSACRRVEDLVAGVFFGGLFGLHRVGVVLLDGLELLALGDRIRRQRADRRPAAA